MMQSKEDNSMLKEYFTIEVLEDCTFNLAVPTAANAIKYKHNDNDWVTTNTNVDITCLANDTVQLSCVCPSRYSGEDTMRNHHFGLRVPFNAYGNVMSLIYGDDFAEQYTLNSNNVFDSLFHMLPIVSAKNLILPATTLSEHCYANMFFYCQMLTEAPQLLATTLSKGCYKNMFGFCTTLTQAPELMADIVAQECYYQMFYGCEALTKAPSILPSMTLDYACYFEMFRECYALTTLPQLPATTLAASCYEYMFDSCSEIDSTMELPSTVLSKRCYYGMFNYCTNLISTPQLKATTLADECYKNMFKSCSNLTTISELPATTLANNCYESMFEGCKKITTAPQLKAIKMGVSSCQYMFKGCTSLIEVPELIATTLANNCYYSMFENCKALESTIDLPSTTLADGCYNSMFKGCSKLTNVIELKATTLANRCYANMFYNCTSLTSVPKLKATTLADECYYRMFYNTNVIPSYPIEIFTNETIVHSGGLKGLFSKTKITDNDLMNILPINSEGKYYLPVLTLENNCYDYMFENCSYLTIAPELPATNNVGSGGYSTIFNGCNSLISGPSILPATSLSTRCYYNMFNGCVSLVNAPELPSVNLSEGCYENMFYECHSLLTAPELKSVRLPKTCYKNMFNGCLRLNNITMLGIKYSTESLYHWVSGVGYEGNFIKAKSASLPSGVNGVPENWNIDEIDVDYDYNYSKEYFTIEALEDGLTVKLSQNASQYRIDGGNWISLKTSTATPSINNGQIIQFRITNPTISTSDGIGTFTINKKCNIEGNIMSLLYGDDFEEQIDLSGKTHAFFNLFTRCITLQSAENLVLPATTLADYCYAGMFQSCSSLNIAPKLHATKLADYCYWNMFQGCTSLETAPELSATTLAPYCYTSMFYGCRNLNKITMLATDISASSCLSGWVNGVAPSGTFFKHPLMSLLPNDENGIPKGWVVKNKWSYDYSNEYFTIEALEDGLTAKLSVNACEYRIDNGSWNNLPADTNTPSINKGQKLSFKGNLTPAPRRGIGTFTVNKQFNVSGNIMSLHYGDDFEDKTDLSKNDNAFYKLFYNCTTLQNAENLILPATILGYTCYYAMFYGCKNLTTAPKLPALELADGCYNSMFNGCTSLVESPKLHANVLSSNCYYAMFSGCTNLNKITMLATDTDESNCLLNWVTRVAEQGTFIKHPDLNEEAIGYGDNGIPSGWAVQDYEG